MKAPSRTGETNLCYVAVIPVALKLTSTLLLISILLEGAADLNGAKGEEALLPKRPAEGFTNSEDHITLSVNEFHLKE